MKEINGFQVDECGRVISSIDGLNCDHINCPKTTGHAANIVTRRRNDVEVTYYKDQGRYGAEVYFFHNGTHNIKYSRNYPSLSRLPSKYNEIVNNLMEHYKLVFGD